MLALTAGLLWVAFLICANMSAENPVMLFPAGVCCVCALVCVVASARREW